MILSKVRCYIYNSKIRGKVLYELYEFINENKQLMDAINSIKVDSSNGFSIQILHSGGQQTTVLLTDFFTKILGLFKEFRVTNKNTLEQVKNQINILNPSGPKMDLTNIKTDYSIVEEKLDWQSKISKIYPNVEFIKIEKLKLILLCKYRNQIIDLEDDKKRLLLLKLLYLTSKQFCYNEFKGAKFGCMSFFSHYQGYMSRLDSLTSDKYVSVKQRIVSSISKLVEQYSDYIINLDRTLVDSPSDTFENQLFDDWDHILGEITTYSELLAKSGLLYNSLDYKIDNVQKEVAKLSDFHQSLFKIEGFADFFDSWQFQRYRSLVNQVYEIFSMLQVSSVERTVLCGALSTIVFSKSNFNYQAFFEYLKDM